MYDIMIVDDEEIIRKGVIQYIDWNKYGYNIVAEAVNGKQAFEIAKDIKPQVILTDIYMPIMDGIEFAQKVKGILPETIFIFLSGYNEFMYAQKAIEIGVFRYLIKPLKVEELLSVLKEVSEELENAELERTKIKKFSKLIHESLPLLKERFFLSLIKGNCKENEIWSRLDYLNISIKAEKFFCIIISLDDYFNLIEERKQEDINIIKFAIQHITKEILSSIEGTFFMFEDKSNEIGILFCYNGTQLSNYLSTLFPLVQHIQEYIRRFFKTSISIGIGRSCENINDVHKSYEEAEEALEYRTAFGKNSILYIEDIKPTSKVSLSSDVFKKVNELVKSVKSVDLESAMKVTDNLFDIMTKNHLLKRDDIHLFLIEIISKLIRIVMEFDGDAERVYGDRFIQLSILNFDIIEDIKGKLKGIIKSTIEFINLRQKTANKNFIQKAKNFIDVNYCKEELSLSMVAESVHISPAYLSQIFKHVMGESFIEYLTKVRINYGKKLLKETNLKTYEVAFQVGYNDAQYFSSCFKKIVGTSPTNYRNIIAADLLDEE
ncbi:response regulator [Clostridium sp. DJ247]|uniref:response regulator n=1 Tax=Clostridium sp. DJ247 TaxID=2726188 RepID=UPI0016280251|nr:response regulator [Clostridium sp. DJ247]MBC2579497.1 response regulator [Clostridium sp. DJ247]